MPIVPSLKFYFKVISWFHGEGKILYVVYNELSLTQVIELSGLKLLFCNFHFI
jgi:hypothetical protein